MKNIYLALICLFCSVAYGQNTPVFSKVTATWCPNCGTWGWEYMEAMKDEFSNGDALALGVHFSGDLQNETAVWFAENLKSVGQPRFFVNNDPFSVGRSTWSSKIQETVDAVAEIKTQTVDIISLSEITIENGKLDLTVNLSSLPVNDAYLGVYLYENNVMNNQSGGSSNGIHPNVLRAAMTVNPEGRSISESGNHSFSADLDASWNEEEVGVLMIVWRKDADRYTMRSSQAISNVALRLSTENELDASLFTISQNQGQLNISSSETGTYELQLNDLLGRTLSTNQFNQEQAIDVTNFVSGNYILSISENGKRLTQQVFIK